MRVLVWGLRALRCVGLQASAAGLRVTPLLLCHLGEGQARAHGGATVQITRRDVMPPWRSFLRVWPLWPTRFPIESVDE